MMYSFRNDIWYTSCHYWLKPGQYVSLTVTLRSTVGSISFQCRLYMCIVNHFSAEIVDGKKESPLPCLPMSEGTTQIAVIAWECQPSVSKISAACQLSILWHACWLRGNLVLVNIQCIDQVLDVKNVHRCSWMAWWTFDSDLMAETSDWWRGYSRNVSN